MQTETDVRRKPELWTDEALDFKEPTPLRRSYIIASLPRSGSQFFSGELWKTGLLGAPCEYLLLAYHMQRPMVNRLRTTTPADYIAKLLACRTSPNGVFGVATHIHQLYEFMRDYPALLEVLAPVTFIYTTRRNKIAQAVSMAKAYSTSAWTSYMPSSSAPPEYSKELIERCLTDLANQENEWERWFVNNQVTPFRVVYEDFAADRAGTIRSVLELLGVQDDEPAQIELPPVDSQTDSTNKEWAVRFAAETAAGAGAGVGSDASADQAAATPAGGPTGLYERFIAATSALRISASEGFLDAKRSRQLFKVVVEQNRALFENARVLDISSFDGRWCLAALDAGAAHVVGVEPDPRAAARTAKLFSDHGISRDSCEIINADIVSALASTEPEAFDLIMCVRFFERLDPYQMFREFYRLRPKSVILDAVVVPSRGPVLRFALGAPQAAEVNAMRPNANSGGIVMGPSDEAIAFLCEFFGFRCHSIDWQQIGITNWIGLHDYERGSRRTYVLERDW
jgi:trehalose 2-sulfotransferase